MVSADRLKKPAATIIGLALVGELLSACGFDDHNADYADWDKGPSAFVKHMVGANVVRQCTGSSNLRADGHVRQTPKVTNGSKNNELDGFNNKLGTAVTITNPEQVHMNNNDDDDGVSHNWYITRMPNGQLAFVNATALVKDNFDCSQPATSSSVPGQIARISVHPNVQPLNPGNN